MSSESRTVLVTGATQGIGLSTSRLLARKGYNLVLAGRSSERLEEAHKLVQLENPEVTVSCVLVDFASIDSAVRAAKEVVDRFRVDLIILNAGVLKPVEKHTADGHSTTFQVNYLAQYFFAQLIIDGRTAKRPIKIVCLSSAVYALCGLIFRLPRGDPEKWLKTFDEPRGFWKRYCLSKFAMTCLPQVLSLQEGVTAVAVNPGVVPETSLANSISQSVRSRLSFLRGRFSSLETAAVNVVYGAENELEEGTFRNSGKIGRLSSFARNRSNVEALVELNKVLREKHTV